MTMEPVLAGFRCYCLDDEKKQLDISATQMWLFGQYLCEYRCRNVFIHNGKFCSEFVNHCGIDVAHSLEKVYEEVR